MPTEDEYKAMLADLHQNLSKAGSVEEVMSGQLGIIAVLLAMQNELLSRVFDNMSEWMDAIREDLSSLRGHP